jgi:serine/threonine protein kinase
MPNYRKGDILHEYKLLQDFTMVGQCRWTFASKGGEEFFLKEFLEPIYPLPSAPGSEKTKDFQRKQCEEFEKHHTAIKDALKGKSVKGGNLVITLDFFREDARFYKVTARVIVAGVDISAISALPLDKRIIVLLTVANSLKLLHQSDIVHGDLKPDNILINKTEAGMYVAKLIDFDSSYFSKKPPAEVVGDPVYYSPELGFYIEFPEKRNPRDLQIQSDIFALGLIYHQYLTGELPGYNTAKYKYAYAAVSDGAKLAVNDAVPPKLRALLSVMLRKEYSRRPDISQIMFCLKESDILSDTPDMNKSVLTPYLDKTTPARGTLIIPDMLKPKSVDPPPEETKGTLTIPDMLKPKPVDPPPEETKGTLSIFKAGTK